MRRSLAPGMGRSRIASARLPPGLLGPVVRPVDDFPAERRLRAGIRQAVVRELGSEPALDRRVLGRRVGADAQVVAEQQWELFREAPSAAHVDVGAWLTGRLAKVPLG